MAVASKIRSKQLVVIDDLAIAAPKTRDMAAILKALKLEGVSILVTTATRDLNVYKSSRNIEGVTVSPVADLNALAILTPKRMLVTKAALDALRERAKAGAAEAGA